VLTSAALQKAKKTPIPVETICLNCVFAQWENKISKEGIHTDKTVRYQTGCQLNLIERFKDKGAEIQEYVDSKSGNEFNSIVGRICMYNRPVKWATQFTPDDNLTHIARKEIRVKTTLIIYVDKNNTIDQLIITLKSINDCTLKPQYVITVFDYTTYKPSTIFPIMTKHCPVGWRVEFTTERNAAVGSIDLCSRKTKSSFLIFFLAGTAIPQTLIEDLDISINDRLNQILLLEPKDDTLNGLIVHNTLVKQIGGKHDGNLIQKIKEIVETQKCQHLIKQ